MSANPQFIFNQTLFVALFPEFAPEPFALALPSYWNMACSYIQNLNSFALNGNDLQLALQQMTAHIAKIADNQAKGIVSAPATAGAQGTESVSLMPPPTKDGFTWWLSGTEYGKALWALLRVKGGVGFYVGGSPQRAAFRSPGGCW